MQKTVNLDFWGMSSTNLINTMREKIFKRGFKEGERPKQKIQELDKYGRTDKTKQRLFNFTTIGNSETLIATTIYKMMRVVDNILETVILSAAKDKKQQILKKDIGDTINEYKTSGRAKRILRYLKKNINELLNDGKYKTLTEVAEAAMKGKDVDYLQQFLTQTQLTIIVDIFSPENEIKFSEGELEYSIPIKYTIGIHKAKNYDAGLDMNLKEGYTNCVCKVIDDILKKDGLVNGNYRSDKFLTDDEKINGVSSHKTRMYKLLKDISTDIHVYLNFKIKDCIKATNLIQIKAGKGKSKRYDITGYQYANHLYDKNPIILKPRCYLSDTVERIRLKEDEFIKNFLSKTDYNAIFNLYPEFKILSYWSTDKIYYVDNGFEITEENKDIIDESPMTLLVKEFARNHRKISHTNKQIVYYTNDNKIARKILMGAIYTKEECLRFGIPGDYGDHQIIDKKDAYSTAIKDCYYSWNKDGTRWMTGVPCESIYTCNNEIFKTDACGMVFVRIKSIPRELCPRDFRHWTNKECSDANIQLFDLVDRGMNFIEAKYWFDNGADIEAYAINPSHRLPDTFTPFVEKLSNKMERVSFIGRFISNPKKQDLIFNTQEEVDYYIDTYVDKKDDIEIRTAYNRFFIKHNTGEFNHGKYPHIHNHLMACHRILMFEKIKQLKAIGAYCTMLKTDSIRFYMPDDINPYDTEECHYPDVVKYTEDIREELRLQREHYRIFKYRGTMTPSEWNNHLENEREFTADRHKDAFDKCVKFKPTYLSTDLLENGKWKYEFPKATNLHNLMTPKHTEVIDTTGLKPFDTRLIPMYKSFVGGAGSGKTFTKESIYYEGEFTEISPTHAIRQKAHAKYTIKKMLVLLGDEELRNNDEPEYYTKVVISDTGLVIDEIGMVSTHEMNRLDQMLREYYKSDLYMAGLPVLIMGDSAQCDPVVTSGMMGNKNYKNMKISFFDSDKYHMYTEFKLTTNERCGNDSEYAKYLKELHDAIQEDDIVKYKQMFYKFVYEGSKRVETIDDIPYNLDSRYICYKVATQDEINKRYISKFNPAKKEITLKLNRKPYFNGDVGYLIDDTIHIEGKVAISLEKYANGETSKEIIRYNYASTIYSQQGNTIKNKYIIIVNDLHKDIKTFYTAISRATTRDDIELYYVKNEPKKVKRK